MAINTTSENVGKLAVAAFASAERAEAALEGLTENGFNKEQIGVIGSTEKEHLLHEWIPQAEESSGDATSTHVVVAGALGGVLGGAAALLIPGVGWAVGAGIVAATIAGGSFGGGLIGPLLHLEVEKDRAVYLDERLRAGDIIVTVQDDDRPAEAQKVLEQFGGKTASS